MAIDPETKELMAGPASPTEKALRKELLKRGTKEERLPKELRNGVVAKSKKGPIGAIVVRNITGIDKNPAKEIVKRFEANVESHGDIVEKLSILPDLKPDLLRLLELLRAPHKKSLARLVADAGAEPVALMRAYARGCVELGKIEAAIAAHRNLPALVKDLYRHALDEGEICKVCVGSGAVVRKKGDKEESSFCPQCEGSGRDWRKVSEHKEFAATKLLEVTELSKKNPGVAITNVQANVQTGGGMGGFLERLLETSDRILYPTGPSADIIDAEVVKKDEDV